MNVSPYSGAVLKRSAMHFLSGKVASGLLSLLVLLMMVRELAVEEYGVYVFLVAGMEIALAITALSLPWVAARYLPEFRLHANGKVLADFVWKILARIALFLFIGVLLLLLVLPRILPLEFIQYLDVARLYLLVLLTEGLGRHVRECALEPLLQQGKAQISLVTRNMILLSLLVAVVAIQSEVHLYHVVLAEIVASVLGAMLALRGLTRYLNVHRELPGQIDWQPPNWSEMWGMARHMYVSHFITLTYSSQVFIFLIQRYLGVEATALFGFLRNLFEHISRYLPATLLFSLIRPKLVASYVAAGDMMELTRNANLTGKSSLFVLMPILVFTWLAGDDLVSLLSGEKFYQTGYYLAGLLLALIPLSQRQILVAVTIVSNKSYLCTWGSSLSMLVLPLAYWLLEAGYGLWSPIIAIIANQIIFNTTLIAALMRTTTYRPDSIGYFKLLAAALLGLILTQQLSVSVQSDWLGLLIMATLAGSCFLLVAYFIKPFHEEERVRLNRLLNRKIFVW